MFTRSMRLVGAAAFGLVSQLAIADPVSDLLSQTGLNSLINGSASGGGVEVDVLNPTGTGDNDVLGLDLFTPENGLGLTLGSTELLGFGNPDGGTAIPLDFLGLDQLTTMLGLAPDSALVDALRNTVGPDGAVIVPVVDSVRALSGVGDALNFDLANAVTLPGFSDEAVGLAIAGSDNSGNASADGLAGVAILTPGASGNGGLIGLAVISGGGSGNGDLIGISVAGDDNSGNGSVAGVAVLGGDQAGNSETLALSAISGSSSGNGALVGVGAVNEDNAGNGGLVGVGAINGDESGNGGVAGVGALSRNNAGNGGFSGVSVINGDDAGNGSTAGVAVLSGDNNGNSDGVAGAVISGDNSGDGGGISVDVGSDDNGDGSGPGGGECEGLACGDSGGEDTLLLADSNCAEGDSDSDGICDDVDDCTDTPEGADVFVTGCHLDENTSLVLRGVNFEFDSLDLTEPSKALLEEARRIIEKHPNALIAIDGHTDSKGADSYNDELSYKRARAIYTHFVNYGIKPERLTFRGFGENVPIAANTTDSGADYPEGRALNRRVELTVVDLQTFAAIKAENANRRVAQHAATAQGGSAEQATASLPKQSSTGSPNSEQQARAELEKARADAQKWERIAREEQQRAKEEAAKRERQAQLDAEEAKRREEKAAEAESSYDEVLEFLEETGAAERDASDNRNTSGNSADSAAPESTRPQDTAKPNNT